MQKRTKWLQEKMRGLVTINAEICKGCGLCVTVCPRACVVMSRLSNSKGCFPAVVKSDKCSGCALCAIVCPDSAIEILRNDQPAGCPIKPG